MERKVTVFAVIFAAVFFAFVGVQAQSGRIYGKVYTQDDEVYQGFIRWDDHETFWDDILDAAKYGFSESESEFRPVEKRIEILGIKISWTQDEEVDGHRRFGILMGRLRSIQRRSRNTAVLELKDGSRMRVSSSGTDIGSSNRGIVVFDREVGRVTVDWSDFEKAVFSPEPAGEVETQADWRLYGTVTAWDGREFRGFIMWDNDESLSSDFLDGESRGEDVEIPFSNIRTIQRKSSQSAILELTSGKRLTVRGSNDVNEENRGIMVKVPHFGKVTMDWGDFERAEFERPPPEELRGYEYFDPGEPLYGVVWDDEGERYQGRIRWDDDEAATYEFLDGELEGIPVRIEFGDIEFIQRRSSNSAMVTLKSGEIFKLQGTCDVNEENRGVFVEDDGDQVVKLDWDQFYEVKFGRL
jgi:hypothetical protein